MRTLFQLQLLNRQETIITNQPVKNKLMDILSSDVGSSILSCLSYKELSKIQDISIEFYFLLDKFYKDNHVKSYYNRLSGYPAILKKTYLAYNCYPDNISNINDILRLMFRYAY